MDLISKLNALKSIEPEKNWVVETRKKVLSETPVLGWKMTEIKNRQENKMVDKFFSRKRIGRDADLSRLCECDKSRRDKLRRDKSSSLRHIYAVLFSKRLAVSAFALVFLVSGGAFTVEASKSSLPGDSLYIVKITAEDVTLAITPEDKKAEVEMQQVDKRREELSKISKNHSDPKQGEKVEMLLGEIETGTDSVGERLVEIKDSEVKAKIAKVINVQTEKSAEFLAEISENLPDVVKDEVLLEKLASAVESNDKIYLTSLAVMAEEGEGSDNAGEEKDQNDNIEDDEEITIEDTEEDTEKEPLDDLNNNDDEVVGNDDESNSPDSIINPDEDEGEVKSDSCVCEIDVECDCAGEGEESEDRNEGDDLKDGNSE